VWKGAIPRTSTAKNLSLPYKEHNKGEVPEYLDLQCKELKDLNLKEKKNK
jgi:hypothetical protein